MLGLASEAGSVLKAYKKYLREGISLETNREYLSMELGDLLWYIAAVASAYDIDLNDIAEANIRRTQDRYATHHETRGQLEKLPVLDENYPEYRALPAPPGHRVHRAPWGTRPDGWANEAGRGHS